jgi:adenylosuccinate synthase
LLDLDTGTYPYVTSSVPASIAAGGPAGVGLGPTAVEKVIGVYKAYQTRVGNGPMPTEIFGQEAEDIRQGGGGVAGTGEFGTTTGRARRIGWFDGVLARHTAAINGITSIALTRLDTLSHAEEVKICTGYEIGGSTINAMPATLWGMEQAKPIYETMPGWGEDVSEVRRLADLPVNASNFVKAIESLIGVSIDMISVGPERNQAIVTRDIFGTVIETK